MNDSTRCFIGLIEDHSNHGVYHGVASSRKSSGCVVWAVFGPKLKGPDTHAAQPRYSLFDNYYSINQEATGGAKENLPHHLDGYTRWNNIVTNTDELDLWESNSNNVYRVVQGNVIGHVQGGRWTPKDAYVEYFQNVVSPVSLYVAQLEERLGYLPVWVDNTIEDFRVFRNAVINGNEVLPFIQTKI